ncbi:addiction module toxin RelE [Natronoflexus pectinivorans]|uniref:RelE toxin of RelEB toxin-antitoxin system n=1 Tax=Natronoflexus pectinivorans TaxID=682526 RepID=A0A4R2GQK8_9BACT|nr:addiction module toxin RelE [Natronoflexus pectinivorans]TCO11019.1 hypothetical protein EV194_101653 [Natronoflexus pectinivorans]
MENRVFRTSVFDKRYSRFLKKFPSLKNDLSELEVELTMNPTIGKSLGNGLYKIRLANKDKNKGKSAGYRVVTYLIDESNSLDVYLIIIYDKSEENSIKKPLLAKLVRDLFG